MRHFATFLKSLETYDDRTALIIKPLLRTERLTYRQLCKQANQAAHFLESKDLKRGDRIMIVAANSPQWVVLFLGAQLLGVIVVPVDARSTVQTVENFIEQTKPKLLFRTPHLLTEFSTKVPMLVMEDLHDLLIDQPSTAPKVRLTGDETAVIVFTSGTTAAPKGVVITQANILSNAENIGRMLTLQSRWRFLSVLPLSHMYELTVGCVTLLSGGCSIHYLPRLTPRAIADGLKTYRITSMLAVPQVLTLFLQRIRQTAEEEGQAKTLERALQLAGKLPLPLRRLLFHKVHKELGGALEFVVTGGAPIPSDVGRAWEHMGVKCVQGYGLTETAPVLTMNTLDKRRLDSQGLVLHGVELRAGKDGEIQARGPNVFKEYWQNPKATREAFTADGWFRTGDVGTITEGWLRIQGRSKFAIVLPSGLKVFPEDIEVVADKHPAFQEVCIVGVSRPDGEAVQAVVLSRAADDTIEKAVQQINGQLESFQHITSWVRWPEETFPRTRLLKIDRKNVQAWANQQTQLGKGNAAEDSHDTLLSIIRLALNQPRAAIKESDRLSEIGLDSLRRLTVVSLIEERLNVSLPETEINQRTTVTGLRELIKQRHPVKPEKTRPRWPYYRLLRFFGNILRETLLRAILRVWVKTHVSGREHLHGLRTPALFIFNHVDGFDVPVIFNALPLRLRNNLAIAFADDILAGHPVLDKVPRLCYGAFNFARKDPFVPSLEYMGKLVDNGWNVTISPEGKISPTGKLIPFKSGIGLLAVELGIPVVPIKTDGLFGTMPIAHHNKFPKKRSTITIRIGTPVTFHHATPYDEARRQLEQIMRDL